MKTTYGVELLNIHGILLCLMYNVLSIHFPFINYFYFEWLVAVLFIMCVLWLGKDNALVMFLSVFMCVDENLRYKAIL